MTQLDVDEPSEGYKGFNYSERGEEQDAAVVYTVLIFPAQATLTGTVPWQYCQWAMWGNDG